MDPGYLSAPLPEGAWISTPTLRDVLWGGSILRTANHELAMTPCVVAVVLSLSFTLKACGNSLYVLIA
jgi:hypothetical protein